MLDKKKSEMYAWLNERRDKGKIVAIVIWMKVFFHENMIVKDSTKMP